MKLPWCWICVHNAIKSFAMLNLPCANLTAGKKNLLHVPCRHKIALLLPPGYSNTKKKRCVGCNKICHVDCKTWQFHIIVINHIGRIEKGCVDLMKFSMWTQEKKSWHSWQKLEISFLQLMKNIYSHMAKKRNFFPTTHGKSIVTWQI